MLKCTLRPYGLPLPKTKAMRPAVSFILSLALLAMGCSCSGEEPLTLVKVQQGQVRGYAADGLGFFNAIPYGEAPVGELRWKAPVPAASWKGVREAVERGPLAPQELHSFGNAPQATTSEDCLFLNVITPAKSAGEKLPVMVWIHGGGFITGDPYSPEGDNIAREGIVYVSISYRTGALGFLALPELSAESDRGVSGNYGLLDMILALQWVRDNIAAFGGDPSKVTIFGESAGGIAVSMLCASPLAAGLFRGAICESGGSFCPVDSVRTDNNSIRDLLGAETFGLDFMHRMGASSLAELRAMSPDKWVSDTATTGVGGFWPTADGYVIPGDQYEMYSSGRFNDVNVIIGTNSDEGSMFVRPVPVLTYRNEVEAAFGPFAARILEAYPASDDESTFGARADIFRETAFSWPSWAWARLQGSKGKSDVYMYYFDQPGFNFGGRPARGAGHAGELPYVFGKPWGPQSEPDERLSSAMLRYWTNFAKTGNPNSDDLPAWPVFDDSAHTVMYFHNGCSLIETPNRPQLELMEEFFAWKRSALAAGR